MTATTKTQSLSPTTTPSTPEQEGRSSSSKRGEFFAVDKRAFGAACALGLNEAVGYLVLTCGTGRSNDESSWSATAIERYTGLNRKFAAPQLIKRLIDNRLLVRTKGGLYPRHRLPPWSEIAHEAVASKPQLIYLPNSLVTGAGEERPLRLLREMQDVRRTQLLVAMYDHNNLANDGGISRAVFFQEFALSRVGQQGRWMIWAFDPSAGQSTVRTYHSPLFSIYVTPKHKGEAKEMATREFWAAMTAFQTTGLLAFIPHAFESDQPQAEMMHALAPEGAAGAVVAALQPSFFMTAEVAADLIARIDAMPPRRGFEIFARRHFFRPPPAQRGYPQSLLPPERRSPSNDDTTTN
jgi:hypothetical protein